MEYYMKLRFVSVQDVSDERDSVSEAHTLAVMCALGGMDTDAMGSPMLCARLGAYLWLQKRLLTAEAGKALIAEILSAFHEEALRGGDPHAVAASCWNGFVMAKRTEPSYRMNTKRGTPALV